MSQTQHMSQTDSNGQKVFRHAAFLLRRKLGSEREDKEFDYMVRMKDAHVFVFSMIGLAAMVIVACISWYGADKPKPGAKREDIFYNTPGPYSDIIAMMYIGQSIITMSTVITIVLIIQKHMLLLNSKRKEWSGLDYYDIASAPTASERLQKQRSFRDAYSLFRSDLKYDLMVEVGIHIVHPVMWTASYTKNTDNSETASHLVYIGAQIFMFSRLYLVTRLIHRFSNAYKDRFEVINSDKELTRTNFRIRSDLTLKMVFYNYTGYSISFISFCTLLFLGFSIFIVERQADSSLLGPDGFTRLENCLWYAYITFATIGYGDYFPVTIIGRLVGIIIGMCGITIINIFSGVLTNRIMPNREQKYIAEYLDRSEAQIDYLDCAAIILQTSYRDHKLKKDVIGAQRSTVMYRAMKNFRRSRAMMEEALTPSNDHVIDNKVIAIGEIVLSIQNALEKQQKEIEEVQAYIDAKLAEIVKMLEVEM